MASSGGNDMLRNSSSSSLLDVRPDGPPPTCTALLMLYQAISHGYCCCICPYSLYRANSTGTVNNSFNDLQQLVTQNLIADKCHKLKHKS